MSYNGYTSNHGNNDDYNNNSFNNSGNSNNYNNYGNNSNIPNNIGNYNPYDGDYPDDETRSSRITNEVIDHYSHEPMELNRNNTVNTSILRPHGALQNIESARNEQEPIREQSQSGTIYNNFINDNPQNNLERNQTTMSRPQPPQMMLQQNILTPPQAYSDVFVQGNLHHQDTDPEQMYQVPQINIIQTPSDFTHPESVQFDTSHSYNNPYSQSSGSNMHMSSQQLQQQQQPYFNEEDYYHYQNDNRLNSSNNLNHSTTPSVISVDEDTRPILNNSGNNGYYQNSDNYNNNNLNYDNSDIENGDGYIDQNGDDYQIRSYLGRDGEMIDPYTNTLPVVYDDDEDEGLDHSRANTMEHLDLGDYSNRDHYDVNTIDKLEFINSKSVNSSTSSANSENRLLPEDNEVINTNGVKGLKRANTEIRKFKLWKGNFVFDSPVSSTLLDKYSIAVDKPENLSNEFKFMRYQAVTCEPNELAFKNFTVRQLQYLRPRQTELMIVITMYNEDHILLGRTLKGVMDNIKYMVKKTHSSTWGPDAWKKIVVCVVSDGRSKINERSLALLSSLGCYQDGFAKDEINDTKTRMHMYEHTTMMNISSVSEDGIELNCNQSTVPVQLLFGLKETNQKKINSHRWAFEGFAELLQPNVITLLDAGTMPGKNSIYELWREFRNPNVGGACGEIKTDLGKNFVKLVNPLVASQNFEYKMSNILDKTTESNFGYITVLPGAFSAYRLAAVRGAPLEKYFYGEGLEDKGFNFFSSNMYLAEDRILCFEIVTKKDSNWILKYCRSSYASTDVPERIPEFILQRRRWLNGSFFAAVYSFCHIHRVWTSGHNIFRKFWFTIEFFYLLFNTLLSWFSLSSFFLVFRILSLSIATQYHTAFGVLSVVFLWLYGISIFSTFILSLGNKPKSTEKYYVLNFLFFAVLMAYMVFCSLYMSVKSFEDILQDGHISFVGLVTKKAFRDLVISMGSTYALYLVASLIYLQPWHMLTSFIQYILLSPSYINILQIYAFCNVHDLSWGTKGAIAKPLGKINAHEDGTFKMEILVSQEEIQTNYNKFKTILDAPIEEDKSDSLSYEEKKTGYYANVRSLVIIFWVMTNFGIVATVLETGGIGDYLAMKQQQKQPTQEVIEKPIVTERATIYFTIVLWLVAFSALIRFIGCSFYMITRVLKRMLRR
ncbi:chitin synthase 1 [Monosporozyma servazzii]